MNLAEHFPPNADEQALELIEKLLQYDPSKRINLYEAMCLPVFDELRQDMLMMPNGNCIPDLFDFTEQEKKAMGGDIRDILIPDWYSKELK